MLSTNLLQLPMVYYIYSFDDIHCLTKSISLQEVSLDGNPFSTDQFYKQTILSNLQNLKQLDMKRVTVSMLPLILSYLAKRLSL